MKISIGWAVLVCVSLLASPLFAVELPSLSGSAPGVAEPSAIAPPLPVTAAAVSPSGVKSSVPPLPVSRPCKQQDIQGLWKLQRVYEEPVGNETVAFNAHPLQYISYEANGIYGKYNGATVAIPPELILAQIKEHAAGLQQYLVQDAGMVYFYQDGVANDTQVCFVVVEKNGSFTDGDMLLMPPKGKISGRLIRHYVKIGAKPAAAPVPNPPPVAGVGGPGVSATPNAAH